MISGAARLPERRAAGFAEQAVAAVRSGNAAPELVDAYYSLCIPFYRQFLGDHWHTGYYDAGGAIGPADQLRMELVIARSVGLAAGQDVLDVGCGVGGPACHLARATGARVRGLTPNGDQLRLARDKAQVLGLADQVGFDQGFASRLPYPDASFDAVLFFESACHFPDRGLFFAEAFRVLRPGGHIAGEDWLASDAAGAIARRDWSRRIAHTWAIPDLDTVAGYAQLLRGAGFDVLHAADLRDEMALLRGFITRPADRADVEAEARGTADPVRRLIMDGLLVLGEAAALGAFTVGRFLARKPAGD